MLLNIWDKIKKAGQIIGAVIASIFAVFIMVLIVITTNKKTRNELEKVIKKEAVEKSKETTFIVEKQKASVSRAEIIEKKNEGIQKNAEKSINTAQKLDDNALLDGLNGLYTANGAKLQNSTDLKT